MLEILKLISMLNLQLTFLQAMTPWERGTPSPPDHGTFESVAITRTGNPVSLAAVEVDGEILVDANILAIAQQAFSNALWWIKDRDNNVAMQVLDTVRGVDRQSLCSSTTNSTESAYAAPAGNCVAWCWNAPDEFTNAAGANGATLASTGRVNKDAGFSIVSYTGNASNNSSVAHGLDVSLSWSFIESEEITVTGLFITLTLVLHLQGTVLQSLRLNTADPFNSCWYVQRESDNDKYLAEVW